MLNEKRINIQFLSFLFIIIITLGCQKNNKHNNFNGGFEIIANDFSDPVGWYSTRVTKTNDYTNFSLDSEIKHSGNYSVSIAIDSTHPQENIAYNWNRTFDEFSEKSSYSISGWIKTKNLITPAFIVVQCWNIERKMIGFATTQGDYQIKGTSDWTFAKKDFTIPEGTIKVRVLLGIGSPENNGGKVWFDDIKIE